MRNQRRAITIRQMDTFARSARVAMPPMVISLTASIMCSQRCSMSFVPSLENLLASLSISESKESLNELKTSRSSIEIRPHLSQCGEEKMAEVEWMDMEVAAKIQVLRLPPIIYVYLMNLAILGASLCAQDKERNDWGREASRDK